MLSIVEAYLPRELAFVVRLAVVLLWIAAIAIVLTGCSTLSRAAAPELVDAVKRYCDLPPADRALLRAALNAQLAPHALQLQCADALKPDA